MKSKHICKRVSFSVLILMLFILIYVVPAISDLLLCAAVGALCVVVMAACVFVGGLTEIENE